MVNGMKVMKDINQFKRGAKQKNSSLFIIEINI